MLWLRGGVFQNVKLVKTGGKGERKGQREDEKEDFTGVGMGQ